MTRREVLRGLAALPVALAVPAAAAPAREQFASITLGENRVIDFPTSVDPGRVFRSRGWTQCGDGPKKYFRLSYTFAPDGSMRHIGCEWAPVEFPKAADVEAGADA